jgi:chromatin remodeling complex protein RSC6|tara:strand:+ start:194 stop:871 length:678 start_codon:yes stop_codon:yes gene_type:complete
MSELKVSTDMSTIEEPSNVILILDSEIKTQEEQIKTFRAHISKLKELKKEYIKEIKALNKLYGKRKKSTGNKSNNGFSKKGPISKELSTFMGKAHDFEISRTDVTKFITAYVKEHKLTREDNGRIFNLSTGSPQAKALSSLLGKPRMVEGPDGGKHVPEDITWFNLQFYLAPHYIKVDASTKKVVPPPPVVSSPPVDSTETVVDLKSVKKITKTTAGARRRKVKT